MRSRILIIDDESNVRKVLATMVLGQGYQPIEAEDGEIGLNLILQEEFQVVITDLKMPKLDGIELLKRVLQINPNLPVIIITAHGTIHNAVEALKIGAFDYITKPFEMEEMKHIIRKAVKTYELASSTNVKTISSEKGQYQLIGKSEVMENIYRLISKVADTPTTVLITGESGTGKELIARALHESSRRRGKPFIKINCAAIPKNLLESELFGFERGAFTGAVSTKPGKFELADHGTLFLDEIAEIPLEMQAKLLRMLQDCEFERVGGIKTIKVDVRLITATNKNLLEEVKNGNFREDLFYRLNVVPIFIPPLRDRTSDIPLLLDYFIEKFSLKLKKTRLRLQTDTLYRLMQYPWPGNIRELENVLERSILLCDSIEMAVADLPPEILQQDLSASAGQKAGGFVPLKDRVKETTLKVEKEMILKALKETNGNITKAAQLLQISRKSLQNKIKELVLKDN